jgi:tetratricopeptide (TPR) repeat protein
LGLCGPTSWAQSRRAPADSAAVIRKPTKLSRQEKRELARRAAASNAPRPAAPALSAKDKEVSEALFVDGVKYVTLEDYPKALDRLLKAYALSPDNAAVNYKIAEANLLSGNLRDATNYAQAAVQLDPKNAYYYLLLAQAQAMPPRPPTPAWCAMCPARATICFNWPTCTWLKTSCPRP